MLSTLGNINPSAFAPEPEWIVNAANLLPLELWKVDPEDNIVTPECPTVKALFLNAPPLPAVPVPLPTVNKSEVILPLPTTK